MDKIVINIGNLNCRSIKNKLSSFEQLVLESEFDITCVTETWLEEGEELEELKADMGDKLDARIYLHNRIKTKEKKRGGGVALILNRQKFGPARIIVAQTKNEVELLAIQTDIHRNKIVVIGIYCPPRKRPKEKAMNEVVKIIGDVRKRWGAIPLVVLGDLNNANFDLGSRFAFMDKEYSPITRRGAALDKIVMSTHLNIFASGTMPPLASDDGNSRSDHLVMYCVVQMNFINHEKRLQTHTWRYKKNAQEVVDSYLGQSMIWKPLKEAGSAEDVVQQFDSIMTGLRDIVAKPVKYIRKSKDKVWITKTIKKQIEIKNNIFKNSGYSDHFKRKRKEVEALVKEAKKTYYGRKLDQLKNSNTRQFYSIVRSMNDPDNTDRFDLTEATGEEDEDKAVQKLQDYFASLSMGYRQYSWHPDETTPNEHDHVTIDEVESALKITKVSGAGVINDVDSGLLKLAKKHLAEPIRIIMTKMYQSNTWPKAFKIETGKPVPKTMKPQSIKELRLVSMTPFVSKVCEQIIIKRSEKDWNARANRSQFGGKKGMGTAHALAEAVQACVELKAKGEIPAMVFFDFSAAFNSGHKQDMVEECANLGVKNPELNLIRSFLTDRQMKLKVGQVTSEGVAMNEGGAAAGSFLGMQLFIANINSFDKYFPKSAKTISYIDDTNGIGRAQKDCIGIVHDDDGVHGVYQSRELQAVCDGMERFAMEKGFKLNTKKTKTMLLHKDKTTSTYLSLKLQNQLIESVQFFKLLGVWLDIGLNFAQHVSEIEKKCARRIWVLRNLRRNGVSIESTVQVYKAQIRSIIEYCAPVLMPMLSSKLMGKLEAIQSRAIKTIVGFDKSSKMGRDITGLEKIEDRFAKLTDNFILKEYNMGNRRGWFEERIKINQELRQRRKIEEIGTNRSYEFNGPINWYRRRLNILLQNE